MLMQGTGSGLPPNPPPPARKRSQKPPSAHHVVYQDDLLVFVIPYQATSDGLFRALQGGKAALALELKPSRAQRMRRSRISTVRDRACWHVVARCRKGRDLRAWRAGCHYRPISSTLPAHNCIKPRKYIHMCMCVGVFVY